MKVAIAVCKVCGDILEVTHKYELYCMRCMISLGILDVSHVVLDIDDKILQELSGKRI